ncbi:MAG: hypothetical protein OEW58_07120 [Gammaproteobacteria bacterium]|nr:hypothetical protein [Gammaproteobacteria bacterium]
MQRLNLLPLLLCPWVCQASTPFIDQWVRQPQAFTLTLQQSQQSLAPGWDLHSQTALAELSHLHSQQLYATLLVARQFDQLQGPQTSDTDGYLAGLRIGVLSPVWQGLQLAGVSEYRYHSSRRESNSTQLDRHIWQLSLYGQWQAFDALALYTGITAGQQQGQAQQGSSTQTLLQTQSKVLTYGLDWQLHPGGHVGVEWTTGGFSSTALYFQHRY